MLRKSHSVSAAPHNFCRHAPAAMPFAAAYRINQTSLPHDSQAPICKISPMPTITPSLIVHSGQWSQQSMPAHLPSPDRFWTYITALLWKKPEFRLLQPLLPTSSQALQRLWYCCQEKASEPDDIYRKICPVDSIWIPVPFPEVCDRCCECPPEYWYRYWAAPRRSWLQWKACLNATRWEKAQQKMPLALPWLMIIPVKISLLW